MSEGSDAAQIAARAKLAAKFGSVSARATGAPPPLANRAVLRSIRGRCAPQPPACHLPMAARCIL
jgi:hypothetical protein